MRSPKQYQKKLTTANERESYEWTNFEIKEIPKTKYMRLPKQYQKKRTTANEREYNECTKFVNY